MNDDLGNDEIEKLRAELKLARAVIVDSFVLVSVLVDENVNDDVSMITIRLTALAQSIDEYAKQRGFLVVATLPEVRDMILGDLK